MIVIEIYDEYEPGRSIKADFKFRLGISLLGCHKHAKTNWTTGIAKLSCSVSSVSSVNPQNTVLVQFTPVLFLVPEIHHRFSRQTSINIFIFPLRSCI